MKLSKNRIPKTPEHRAMYQNFEKLHISNGILECTITNNISGEKFDQLVIPSSHRYLILRTLHDEMGYQGRDRTISLIRDRFFWYGQTRDVENWISSCDRCLRRKTPCKDRAELVNIESSQPLELVCMDFLSLETSKGGY